MSNISTTTNFYKNSGNRPLLNLVREPGGLALDCGCGAGDNARLLKEKGWLVTGITISVSEQQAAIEHCNKVYLANLENGLPPAIEEKYHLVVLSHVLEHLVDPTKLLQDTRRVLHRDGQVAVALPNVLAYRQRFKFLLGKFEYEDSGTMDRTHVRFYTPATGAALLRSQGFEIVTSEVEGAFPLWRFRKLLPPGLVGKLNRLACRRWPGLFGSQSLYIVRLPHD
ncbi:MAG: hypothetical protein JWP00_4521 [Chloroflexi bacterium]|jgi:2-polyprenyl-3-methyl-5-hydroxy-6-metoxy-1,4-benzoquinol methylase|nr:hypothetical protein [Chloroflexota bacterium]